MKNHYIPQFYLKRWAVDGCLVEFARRRPGMPEVVPIRRSPAATGYRTGLYDFDAAPPEKRHAIEKAFFSMVDFRAADALVAIEKDEKLLRPELKGAWVMFLLSLITRHPEDIVALKAAFIRDFKKTTEADRRSYAKARPAHYPPTLEEFLGAIEETALPDMAVANLPKLILHERTATSLLGMHWSVAEPPRQGYFLSSDRPTIRTFLGQENSHWLLPIGPKHLFVAAQTPELGFDIHESIAGQGWKEVNRQVVRQAASLGYADGDRHLPFFQKHLAASTRASIFLSFVSDPHAAPALERVP